MVRYATSTDRKTQHRYNVCTRAPGGFGLAGSIRDQEVPHGERGLVAKTSGEEMGHK